MQCQVWGSNIVFAIEWAVIPSDQLLCIYNVWECSVSVQNTDLGKAVYIDTP